MTDAERITMESRATKVTLFEDRAEVTRRASGALPAGVTWVTIAGVSVLVDDASVVSGIQGERARVIATRVVRQVRSVPAGSAAEIEAAEADQLAAQKRETAAERAREAASAGEERATALGEQLLPSLARAPRGDEARAKWLGAQESVDQAVTRGLDDVAARRGELERARLDLQRAVLRLSQMRAVHPRYEAAVEAQIEAREAHEVEIELTYRVPCALWRPEHMARLSSLAADPITRTTAHQLTIRTYAAVWQNTGEVWRDVACRFSTARPARAAAPPLLTDDVLHVRRKTDAERKTINVELREQTIAVTGLDRGARAVEEMPGVDDGGEPLWFEARQPVTIASDGQVLRLEIGEITLPCEVDLVAFPERSMAAHLRATATLTSATPLLAGPVALARESSLVGRGKLAFVGRGEPFELGFGVDDGLRIRRAVQEKRETTVVIGTQKIERTVRLYVGNTSDTPRQLTVIERYPVSEITDVRIEVTSAGGARLDAKDGYARFALDVRPNATEERSMVYRIEAAAKVNL